MLKRYTFLREETVEKIYTKHVKEIKGSKEEATIINVLSKEDFQHERIPGSINIPLEDEKDFVQRVESVVPSKKHKVIVHCTNNECSASTYAARLLDEAGFTSVMDYKGGIEEWKEMNETVETGKPKKDFRKACR